MLKCGKWSVWGFVLLAVFSTALNGQNFVYTNNDQGDSFDASVQNSVSAFSVTVNPDSSISLTPISGSPFSAAPSGQTNARGTRSNFYAPNRIIVVHDFLYASNAGSSTISAFTINTDATSPDFGALRLVDGSPFATQGSDGSPSGISLAATPDGKYLYAGTTGLGGQITIFSIDSAGALTRVGSSPVAAGGPMSSMKVTPDGKFLAVALYQSNQVAMFGIQPDGNLEEVSDPPFALNAGVGGGTGIDINCASNRLFVGRSGPDIDVLTIDSAGTLSEPEGPFSTTDPATGAGPTSNQAVILNHPEDTTLFSSNQGGNTVTTFAVGSDGSLTVPGVSVGAGSGAFYPGGLSVSQDGKLLYAGDVNAAISTFAVDSSSSPVSLTVQPVTSTGQLSGLHSIAAYPANVCPSPQPSNSLIVTSLQITGGPPPALELDATLSLDSSFGANPFLTQAVTFHIGDFMLPLPKGSFKTFQEGMNAETDLFQGVINGTTFKVQITPLGQNESGQNQFQIRAFDKQVDLPGMDNVTVKVCIGDNDDDNNCPRDDDVVPSFPNSLRGNWRDY